jgi:hypothetical protein
MSRLVIRAVRQSDGSFRAAASRPDRRLDSSRHYSREEIDSLANELDADVRWLENAETAERGSEASIPMATEPWGGTLPPVED